MDGLLSAILDKIYSLAATGRYVIFSREELFDAFPDGTERSESELKKALKNLLNAGYIDVKYSSGNMYCIAPLKKYVEPTVIIDDGKQSATKEFTDRKNDKKNLAFLAAFAGGALGSMIVCLIFSLINYA